MKTAFDALYSASSILGKSVKSGRHIGLVDPFLSTYLLGAHGTGKSTVALNLALADIEKADKGVVFLDPHGDTVKSILLRCPPTHAKRIIYFSPTEQQERVLGLNPFEIHDESEYEIRVEATMNVFAHSWYGGFSSTPTMQNTLETLVRSLLKAYPIYKTNFLHMLLATRLDEVGKMWRQKLGTVVKDNPALAQNWVEWMNERRLTNDFESSRQKIKHILSSDVLTNILCQAHSAKCFQFQDLLSQKGILLVNLEGLDDEGQRLLGSIILNQLLVMARLRIKESDRIACHIYADEFYKFSPQSFVTIINEARKFNLFCTLAHQNLEQLNKEARAAAANCGNIIVFHVGPEDAGIMSRHFLAKGQTLPAKILSNLPRFHALVRYTDRIHRRQAALRTFPPRGRKRPTLANAIRARSETYGTPIENIRKNINVILDISDNKFKTPPRRTRRETSDD